MNASQPPTPDTLLRLTDITRVYPGVTALASVSFDLRPGEIHCLVGENGAGKSTLMRILSGAETPTSGTIEIGGKTYPRLSPALARAQGVGIIYQETDLVMTLSIAQNVFLGREPRTRLGVVDWKRMRDECGTLLRQLGLDESPDTLARALSPATRQLVQIVKALSNNSRILILDEPTTALSRYETERLFQILRELRAQGKGLVFISHRLEEVLTLGDRVTVLRDGRHIVTTTTAGMSEMGLIEHMVGRPLGEQFGKRAVARGEVVLSVRGLTVDGHFEDVSFDLHRGEILGLAGLVGAGRTALLGCLFGALKPSRGEIIVHGAPMTPSSPKVSVRNGFGLVPEDRRESGLVLNLSVERNIALTVLDRLQRFLFLDERATRDLAHQYVERIHIKTPGIQQRVKNLSGGNQQKVVLSKWLAANTRILLLDEPTRGIDVGAKAEIYHLINELAEQGLSVLMASSELVEILGLSDRVLVMAEGRVTGELVTASTSQEEIMRYAVVKAPAQTVSA